VGPIGSRIGLVAYCYWWARLISGNFFCCDEITWNMTHSVTCILCMTT
jgi:hypothetical protein